MIIAEIPAIPSSVQQLITGAQAWHYQVIPAEKTSAGIVMYASENADIISLSDELEVLLGVPVRLITVSQENITRSLGIYYRRSEESAGRLRTVDARRAETFLQDMISEAKVLGSSDIHIEAYEMRGRVRFRIDGNLVEFYSIPRQDYPALINKIKIRASLDIAEKRLPQDGRIMFREDDQHFDIRVSVLPTLHGEKVVLRLLNNDAASVDIEKLGFSVTEKEIYISQVRKPHGIVLISGPTGSGKTTTLYATLKLLNKEKTNIVTIEDPIEYTLEGINQVQLRESIGLTFAGALRTFLRQDPDVIMLGEIRDPETARMAIRAAQTGHLVLSTIHTNSAWGTIARLSDMGIPQYLLANTINLSVAQRLVRLLCQNCRVKDDDPLKYFSGTLHHDRPQVLYKAGGCGQCHFTGYKGRKAIYEILPVTGELSDCIRDGVSDVKDILARNNIRSLGENAMALLFQGETSFEDVFPFLNLNGS